MRKKVDLTASDVLDGILDALFQPPLGPAGGAESYARIFGGRAVGRERDQVLFKQHCDPTALEFLRAFQPPLEDQDRSVAAQSYTLAFGSLIAVIGRDGRIERLMGDATERLDTEVSMQRWWNTVQSRESYKSTCYPGTRVSERYEVG